MHLIGKLLLTLRSDRSVFSWLKNNGSVINFYLIYAKNEQDKHAFNIKNEDNQSCYHSLPDNFKKSVIGRLSQFYYLCA